MPASHRPLGFGDDQPYLCKYSVFWSEKCKSDAKKSFDSNDSYISFATSYLIKIAMLLNEFSSAYLWSIGKFNLCLDPESSAWENICLVGKYFTFSLIDDAKIWIIIVKTLLHVSKALPELIISVQDNFYGDLLLVTCGSMLPSWVKSDEISMNRTFISAGKFHFISKELISSKKRVPLKDALAAVSSPMTITSMNREMCSILDNLLASSDVYLDSILQSGKRLYPIALPRKIAGILLENPSLIAVTCDTYNSNVHKVSVKEFSKITKQHQSYFEPEEPVKVLLPLTKKCFALLDSQQLPLYISESQDLSSTLGTKLAWGYMILLEYIDKNSGDSNFTAPFSANIEEAVKYARLHLDQQVSTKEALDALRYLESPIIVDSNLIQKSLSDGKFACLNESGDMELQLWDAFSEDELRSLIYGPTHMQESVAENQAGEDEDGDDFFFTSDEENSDGLDCNQEYDEFEVLDTLLRDPELLMKVIERYSASGESSKDLLSKLSKLKIEQVQEHTPSADEIPNSEDSDSQLSSNDDAFSE